MTTRDQFYEEYLSIGSPAYKKVKRYWEMATRSASLNGDVTRMYVYIQQMSTASGLRIPNGILKSFIQRQIAQGNFPAYRGYVKPPERVEDL